MNSYVSNRNTLMQFVESHVLESGYNFVDKLRVENVRSLRNPVYSKGIVVGRNIYDNVRKCHFILFHPHKWEKGLVIEVRWQGVNGTIDEKFPFIVMNIKRSGFETVVVMGGPKLKPEVSNWVGNQIGYRLIEVFNPGQFQIWVNQGNL